MVPLQMALWWLCRHIRFMIQCPADNSTEFYQKYHFLLFNVGSVLGIQINSICQAYQEKIMRAQDTPIAQLLSPFLAIFIALISSCLLYTPKISMPFETGLHSKLRLASHILNNQRALSSLLGGKEMEGQLPKQSLSCSCVHLDLNSNKSTWLSH